MRRLLPALSVFLLSQAAVAGDPNAWFRKLDRNHDGFLDRKELAGMRRHLAVFDQADENKDGRLSPDEFIKAESLIQEARQRRASAG